MGNKKGKNAQSTLNLKVAFDQIGLGEIEYVDSVSDARIRSEEEGVEFQQRSARNFNRDKKRRKC